MKKTERLNGIIFALKERGKLTAAELADLFEVSMRTIYRDIDALSQLKVPIYTYDGVNGGYEIDMDYFIPSITLSEQEIIMLLMVLDLGETIKLPNLSGDYQILKGKVINTLTDVDRHRVDRLMSHILFGGFRLEPTDYSENVLKSIFDSFMDERMLDIVYYNPRRDEYGQRSVSPTQLFFDEGGWYMTAYCHLRNEKRVFRLDRIKSVQILDQENLYLGKEISSATDKFVGREYTLEIEKSLFRVLKDNDYLSDVQILSDNDPMTIQFKTHIEVDVTNVILNNPTGVTILAPEEYRNRIKQTVKELSEKYI